MRIVMISTRKLLLSCFAVSTCYLGLYGVSLVAELVAGTPLGHVFKHKLLCLGVIAILQIGIVLTYPVNNRFQIYLRIIVVIAGCILSTLKFGSELADLRLISSGDASLLLGIATLMALMIGVAIYRKMDRRMRAHCAAEGSS